MKDARDMEDTVDASEIRRENHLGCLGKKNCK